MQRLWQDLRYATRLLAKSPGFAAIAILTLSIGIGANTAIFSVVNSTLLRPLAYRQPQQLYIVREIEPQLAKYAPTLAANVPDFRIWQKRVHSFDDVAIAESTEATLTGVGEPEVLRGVRASANIFDLLGARPVLGRTFHADEDESARGNVVILTDAFWQNRFHGDVSVIGKSVTLNGTPCEIVGVLPKKFQFPAALGGTARTARIGFFQPLNGLKEYERDLIGEFDFAAVARLKPDVSQEQAVAELNVVQAQIAKEANEGVDLQGTLLPLEEEVVGPGRQGLIFLLGAVASVLLIVCANLAGLMLARVPRRMREAAVRTAMGATQRDIFRQILTETFLFSVLGGGIAIWIANLGLKWLVRAAPSEIPRLEEAQIDWRVLFFALAVSVASGCIVGFFPAWQIARSQPIEVLKSGTTATTENRRTRRLREILVGFEIGLTTVLLVLAGLLVASLGQLLHVHTGFVAEKALVASVSLPPGPYPEPEQRLRFYDSVLAEIRSLPGVRAAGWVSIPPLGGQGSVTGITVPGTTQTQAETPVADYRPASPDYFQAMGISLLKGRIYSEADRHRKVVVISESVAQRFWPGEEAVGKICVTQWGPDVPAEVIGVVDDIRITSLDEAPAMMVYVPAWFNAYSASFFATFVLRTESDPSVYGTVVREAIRRMDTSVPVTSLSPMTEVVSKSVDERRFPIFLAVTFGLSSLLLASLGIFGVVGYSVERRRQELGIRVALGADLSRVQHMVIRQGMLPVVLGLAAGGAAAFFGGQLIGGLLFGVRAYDPPTFAGVVLLVFMAALVACYFPARRATKVDPMVALRYE